MITKRNGFNNGAQGKIDLNDYSQIAHPPQSGKFIKFGWLDLDQVDPEDPNASNYQVRAEGTTRARIDEFKNEFKLYFHAHFFHQSSCCSHFRILFWIGMTTTSVGP